MKTSPDRISRGKFVAGAVILPALAALILTDTGTARAKGSQAQFKYQNSPKNGQKCAECTFFIPGKTATAKGGCKIVDGSISPNGWCTAYSHKS